MCGDSDEGLKQKRAFPWRLFVSRQGSRVPSVLGVMTRFNGNERAEGRKATQLPALSGDLQLWHLLSDAALSLAGSMRPTVVTRESDLFWRQTDDEHPRCICNSGSSLRRFCRCGHYELGGCTDESSASRPFENDVECSSRSTVVDSCTLLRDFFRTGFVGLAAINPTHLLVSRLRRITCPDTPWRVLLPLSLTSGSASPINFSLASGPRCCD
jgi:hypothetical protein